MSDINPFNRPDIDPDAEQVHADVTGVPPKEYLPASLHALVDARDKAYDAFVDFESDHAELLQGNWVRVLRDQDEAAGRDAVLAGKDPLSIPSALEAGTLNRPRVIGALRALRNEVHAADRRLVAAIRRELPAIADLIEPDVTTAAEEYIRSQRQADAARQRYGAKLALRSWVSDWSKLDLRTDFVERQEATPTLASGGSAVDIDGRPIDRGAAEVGAIDASYGALQGPGQRVKIRSKRNGVVLELFPDQAAALMSSGEAEYVTDDGPDAA